MLNFLKCPTFYVRIFWMPHFSYLILRDNDSHIYLYGLAGVQRLNIINSLNPLELLYIIDCNLHQLKK